MTETIFDKLGGEGAVNAAVDIFYRRVLSDNRVSGFFDTTNMDKQRAKQKAFLTMVFGGPNEYTGKDLKTAHAPLVEKGLNDTHFDIVLDHLRGTLDDLNVEKGLVDHVVNLANTTREDVLGRSPD
jgi:hemoglobin